MGGGIVVASRRVRGRCRVVVCLPVFFLLFSLGRDHETVTRLGCPDVDRGGPYVHARVGGGRRLEEWKKKRPCVFKQNRRRLVRKKVMTNRRNLKLAFDRTLYIIGWFSLAAPVVGRGLLFPMARHHQVLSSYHVHRSSLRCRALNRSLIRSDPRSWTALINTTLARRSGRSDHHHHHGGPTLSAPGVDTRGRDGLPRPIAPGPVILYRRLDQKVRYDTTINRAVARLIDRLIERRTTHA